MLGEALVASRQGHSAESMKQVESESSASTQDLSSLGCPSANGSSSTIGDAGRLEQWSSSRWRAFISNSQAESVGSREEDGPAPAGQWSASRWRGFLTPPTTTCTRCSSLSTLVGSDSEYALPSQTLLFLDWDDTLFPSTELFQRHGVCERGEVPVAPALRVELGEWREALRRFLVAASSLTDKCVILTNSERPWVTECVERFAPELLPMFTSGAGGVSVLYAEEAPEPKLSGLREALSGSCLSGLAAWYRYAFADNEKETKQARVRRMTTGKRTAMRSEAADFYSMHREQSWKNVIGVGDARVALLELAVERRRTELGQLRAKALTVPPRQSLRQATFSLRLLRTLLPTLVRYDGSLDAALTLKRPLEALAGALDLRELAELPAPSIDDEAQVTSYIAEAAELLHGAMVTHTSTFGA